MKLPKTRTASELRQNLFETIREVQEGDPQVITHTKGSDAVVLISHSKLNALFERVGVLEKINRGIADIKAGRVIEHDEVAKRIKKMQERWQKQK